MAEILLNNDTEIGDLTGPVVLTDVVAGMRPNDGGQLQRITAEQLKHFADGFQSPVATDADFTLTPWTSSQSIKHTGTLTADRAVTLSTTGAYAGAKFMITRTGGGAFNLNVGVGPLKALATNEWAIFRYDGSAWYLGAFGSLAAASASGTIYDFGCPEKSGQPTTSEVLGSLLVGPAVTIAADMAGSFGSVTANPTAQFDVDVQDDGASIGTISVATNGAFTFTTAGNVAINVAAGSKIRFVAPASTDATIDGFMALIAATVT